MACHYKLIADLNLPGCSFFCKFCVITLLIRCNLLACVVHIHIKVMKINRFFTCTSIKFSSWRAQVSLPWSRLLLWLTQFAKQRGMWLLTQHIPTLNPQVQYRSTGYISSEHLIKGNCLQSSIEDYEQVLEGQSAILLVCIRQLIEYNARSNLT